MSTSELAAATPTSAGTNLYDDLSLDRNETTASLRQSLHELKLQWTAKAARAGRLGEHARAQLKLIADAKPIFSDEDSRERYDLSLIRTPVAAPEDAQVDWLTKAWAYYFLNDNGAAAVAARKAREQSPDDALAYVVSAWIRLRDDELKQAKQDADEAYVLDELGEDIADVHHVRGFVFYLLAITPPDGPRQQLDASVRTRYLEQSVNSFDRALAKASDGEKSEIYMRKSYALEAARAYEEMFDACERGLSLDVDIVQVVREGLEDSISRAITALSDDPEHSRASLENYRRRKGQVLESRILARSKSTIAGYIDQNIARHEKLQALRDKIASLEANQKRLAAIQNAEGMSPDFPIKSMGIAIISLLVAIICGAGGSGGAATLFVVMVIAFGAFAGVRIARRSEWTKTRNAYQEAQSELQRVHSELLGLKPQIPDLTRVRALTR